MNRTLTITRYISFVGLISTIEDGLFIPKGTLFNDELEGILPYYNSTDKVHVISRKDIRKCMEWIYISCWHTEPHECHAMWKIYGQSNEAVAIQTTELDLRLAFMKSGLDMQSYLDSVNYKNPETEDFKKPCPVEVLTNKSHASCDSKAIYAALLSFIKHLGYSYEKELRLVVVDKQADCNRENSLQGIYIPQKLTREMIKRIIIHPFSKPWFEELVRSIVKERYEMSADIVKSTLTENTNKGL